MKPLLLYFQQLQESSQLIEGRLLLLNAQKNCIQNTYIATSGCPGHQSSGCISARGKGPIPPINSMRINHYSVATQPFALPNVRGVEGNFYKILPEYVTVEGV
ncbi:hypothetical protein [Mastigocladopsis repens]|uniref:hypothetical protein n=1 Tax=Mastigocladopsis repens TaxID=221287 RepID=UPI0002D27CE6|nr:hypothetical protein [Mastigocladopsis repens]